MNISTEKTIKTLLIISLSFGIINGGLNIYHTFQNKRKGASGCSGTCGQKKVTK